MVLIYGIILALPVSVIVFLVSYLSMRHKHNILWNTILFRCMFAFYLGVLFAITFLGRADVEGVSFIPFTSYIEAWEKSSLIAWRNILINIVLFVPFGFLISLTFKKINSLLQTSIFTVIFSFCIELLQVLSNRGIFEIDDVINNLVGSVVGYTILKLICKCVVNKENL